MSEIENVNITMSREEYDVFRQFKEQIKVQTQEETQDSKPDRISSEDLGDLKEFDEEIKRCLLRLGFAEERKIVCYNLLAEARTKRNDFFRALGEKYGVDIEKYPKWGLNGDTGEILLDTDSVVEP